jgi:hypothetical protein
VNKETWDVFNEHVSGSKDPNETGEFKPKAATSAFNPGALSCLAEILTREPAGDEVNGFKLWSGDVSDVSMFRHLGPMLRQNFAAERIYFHLPFTRHPGTLKAKIHSADPAEETTEGHLILRTAD